MRVHEFQHEMRTTTSIFGRKHNVSVVFEGDRAGTDGNTIFLPSLPLSVELTNAQVKAMRGYVDHEAGHIRHSDMPRIMDFYDRCENNGKSGLRSVHNCLEDIWMEQQVIDEYPGAEKNITATVEAVKAKEIKGMKEAPPDFSKITPDLAGLGITTVGREAYGGAKLEELLSLLPDNLKEHTKVWSDKARDCTCTEEVITLAKSVYKLLEEDPTLSSKPEDFDPTAGEGMEEGEPSEDEGKGKGEGEGKEGYTKDGDAIFSDSEEEGEDVPGGILRPKGNYKGEYRVVTTAYDKDRRNFVNKGNINSYIEARDKLSGNISVMKAKLKRALLAKQNRGWDYGRESGKLDSKRLVAASLGSPSVFKRREDIEEEDTAITILIDLSGSMHGKKSLVTRDCVIALSECLSGSNYTFNIVGFHNKGSGVSVDPPYPYHRIERTVTFYFKDFDTPLRSAKAAIGSIPNQIGGNNSDYDFIVAATDNLRARPERRKVLLVLSDGEPANRTNNVGFGELVRHARLATRDANRKGVQCVGIGIRDDSVEDIYDNCVVVWDVDDLSSKVFNKLTDILVKGK